MKRKPRDKLIQLLFYIALLISGEKTEEQPVREGYVKSNMTQWSNGQDA